MMKIANPENEYIEKNIRTNGNSVFYRLQQVYNGIPVYKQELIVVTDLSGYVKNISGEYIPITLNTTPKISEAEAISIIKEEYNITEDNVISQELVIYIFNRSPVLTWRFSIHSPGKHGKCFISATTGDIIEFLSGVISDTSQKATGIGLPIGKNILGVPQEFFVTQTDAGTYLMKDKDRKISIFDANHSYVDILGSHVKITSSINSWNIPAAVSAISNIKKSYDFYTSVLEKDSFNVEHRKMNVWVNYRIDSGSAYNNAAYWEDLSTSDTAYLTFGDAQNHPAALDVVAHEYTHAMEDNICGLDIKNESGAVKEAYADIIGSLIEGKNEPNGLWTMGEDLSGGALRNLFTPRKLHGDDMHDYCYLPGDHEKHKDENGNDCDYGGVHRNCGILNYAAYLMWDNGIKDKEELAKLFYNSMEYLTSTSGFLLCRSAILAAAQDMGMSNAKKEIIRNAFDAVNITSKEAFLFTGKLTGIVRDAETKEAIQDATVSAESDNSEIFSGIAFTDANGEFSLKLLPGTYKLTIKYTTTYKESTIENVVIHLGETTQLPSPILLSKDTSTGDDGTTPMISAGYTHTVALKSNGTVVAVGDNADGQCNVASWNDIIAVSARTYHTVGLKKDGTVVATGRNADGQCNVSSWNDIIAVSAGEIHTVGLKKNGTVMAVGNNYYGTCNVSSWNDIIAVSGGTGHTVGLKKDGTVVATGMNFEGQCNVSSWNDIIAVSAGHTYTLGLKKDGAVIAVGGGAPDVSSWNDIIAVSAGAFHIVGLKKDGTAVAVGYNYNGQCNISGGNLGTSSE